MLSPWNIGETGLRKIYKRQRVRVCYCSFETLLVSYCIYNIIFALTLTVFCGHLIMSKDNVPNTSFLAAVVFAILQMNP